MILYINTWSWQIKKNKIYQNVEMLLKPNYDEKILEWLIWLRHNLVHEFVCITFPRFIVKWFLYDVLPDESNGKHLLNKLIYATYGVFQKRCRFTNPLQVIFKVSNAMQVYTHSSYLSPHIDPVLLVRESLNIQQKKIAIFYLNLWTKSPVLLARER